MRHEVSLDMYHTRRCLYISMFGSQINAVVQSSRGAGTESTVVCLEPAQTYLGRAIFNLNEAGLRCVIYFELYNNLTQQS